MASSIREKSAVAPRTCVGKNIAFKLILLTQNNLAGEWEQGHCQRLSWMEGKRETGEDFRFVPSSLLSDSGQERIRHLEGLGQLFLSYHPIRSCEV